MESTVRIVRLGVRDKDGVVHRWHTPDGRSYNSPDEDHLVVAYEEWYRRNTGLEPPKRTLAEWRG